MVNEFILKQVGSDVQKAINNALHPDTTLTESGVPADAAAVGELVKRVANLESGEEGTELVLANGWGSLDTVQGYINTSGAITEHASYIASDFIPAVVGTQISYNVNAATGVCCLLAVYDANKTFLKNISLMATDEDATNGIDRNFTGTYTIPEGVAYFRIMDKTAKTGAFTYTVKRGKTELALVSGWNDLNANAGYLKPNGKVTSDVNYVTSDYLPAFPNKTMTYNVQSVTGICCVIAVYDKYKNFLEDASVQAEGGTGGKRQYFSGTLTFPEDAAFFRIMDYKEKQGTFAYYDYVEVSTITPWTGKRWFAFGTSITDTGYTNAETGTPTGKYAPYLVEMSGLVIDNHGIAGGTIGKGGMHGGSANILNEILTTDLSTADLITIEGFVNDFACAVALGELGDDGGTDAIADTETITIRGALYRAVKHCLETAPNALVILLTESTGKEYTLTSTQQTANYCVNKKNSLNLFQKDYNDAIIEMGHFMGVRVIDAGSNSQINCFNPEYIIDQIHHTELGGKQYATVIWDELKNITPKVIE